MNNKDQQILWFKKQLVAGKIFKSQIQETKSSNAVILNQ